MSLIPEIYTDKLEISKNFYHDVLGFDVEHSLEGYCRMGRPSGEQLLLCQSDSPFVHKIFHPAYRGEGLILHFSVNNADALYQEITLSHATSIVLPLQSEDTNGRHFTVRDPNGVLIDIVQGGDL